MKHFILKSFFLMASSLLVCLYLASCTSVSYVGQTFPETRYVKVFTNSFFISDSEFKLMGTGTYDASEGEKGREIKDILIKRGREIGADAILIESVSGAMSSSPEVPLGKTSDSSTVSPGLADKKVSEGKETAIPLLITGDTKIKVNYYKYTPLSTEQLVKKLESDVNVKQLLDSQEDGGVGKVEKLVEEQNKKDKASSQQQQIKTDKIPDNVDKMN